MMVAQADRFDVLIVGGGPVGLSMALSLTRFMTGARIGLVDRRPMSVPQDSRASAIAAGVRRVFETLGVWDAMAEKAQPITAMNITDSGAGDLARPLYLRFEGDVAPGEAFAHMVPNRTMAEALLAQLGDGIEVVAPADIVKTDFDSFGARLTLGDGRQLQAALIIGADGAQSSLRQGAGIGVVAHDYGQNGIVTTIEHELDHQGVAYEHFRPAGPFASLPLPGRRSSLVWTETRANAAHYLAMDAQQLALEIESVMGSSLGSVQIIEKVQSFPLRMQIAREMVAPRLALIGDAAHVVHPIAGQGLNLGLKDVAALAEVVIEAMRLGMDHGGDDVLLRYQSWRRLDTSAMAMVTDMMNRLFSNDIAPVRALRDLGLGLVDRAGPLKDAMIRNASGLTGSGPRLLLGQPI
ncbi:FAD-dependent monooxygenase [Devosia rhodophyticola]|uniref:FAD-dependent monooxygenase n=1 Tax=Devosia rhodophyticola TaxID=3026423 RepID=A0ABY7Z184_9HYPH|nr:FAD-dependent monooxygenase [Devosia rhodophyticola]WDR07398.1 FAD-dependent monooxygenase [Devosia rhodophyticola]